MPLRILASGILICRRHPSGFGARLSKPKPRSLRRPRFGETSVTDVGRFFDHALSVLRGRALTPRPGLKSNARHGSGGCRAPSLVLLLALLGLAAPSPDNGISSPWLGSTKNGTKI